MKQIMVVISLVVLSFSLASLADEDRPPERKEMANEGISLGGTFGPLLHISKFGNGTIYTLGGRINMTLAKMFLLGIGAHGKIAQSNLEVEGRKENLTFYYGGLGAGVRLFPHNFFHLTNYNTFGIGKLNLNERNESSITYLIQPELNVEFDFLVFFRMGAGISYRWMFAPNINVDYSSLSGFGGQLYFEFGWI